MNRNIMLVTGAGRFIGGTPRGESAPAVTPGPRRRHQAVEEWYQRLDAWRPATPCSDALSSRARRLQRR